MKPRLSSVTSAEEYPPSSLASDGAHLSSTPVSECPNAMIGQPPLGGLPAGTATTPETSVSSPLLDVDRNTTRTAVASADASATLFLKGFTSTNEPGPSSVMSAGGNSAAPANIGCSSR